MSEKQYIEAIHDALFQAMEADERVVVMGLDVGINGGVFRTTDGLTELEPSTPYDAKGMLMAAIHDPNPVIFFEHKKCYRAVRGEVPDGPYEAPLREAQYRRRGSDVSVVAYGYMLHETMAVADKL